MDFRKNKKGTIDQSAITDRNYGIYDGMVMSYNRPLTDNQIQWITTQLQSNSKLQSTLDEIIEQSIKSQVDESVEKAIDKALKGIFK